MVSGKVKWFSDAKGYGFLEYDGDGDVFVHFTQIQQTGFRTLKPGQPVQFEMSQGDKGLHASNVVPDRMARLVNAALAGDFGAARAEHLALLPLMLVNFIESNPIPVKAALAMMGLCEEVYRLPMVPPAEASRGRIRQTLADLALVR